MGNVNANSNDKTMREKVLKKAAMLATVASITGACAVGAQQPKESKALIGAIIGIITTVVSVGAGIASSVQSGVAQSEQDRQARLQAEEEERARKQAEEEERIRVALESSENNVRVAQQISAQAESANTAKEIDISIANNDELMAKSASRVSMHTTGVNRVTGPKDINVGGFGSSDEVVESEEISQSEDENILVENEEMNVENIENENIYEETQEISNETPRGSLVNISSTSNSNESSSNIVRFSLSDLEADENFSSNSGSDVVKEEVVVHGVGLVDGYNSDSQIQEDEYVEIDESMLMSVEDAENHILVQEGFLTAEDLIILDFGIRNGAIDQEIIDTMYENGDISDEYYEGAIELMNEIYEELSQEE